MDWHPFAEKFPLLTGAEWEAFKASILKDKGDIRPIEYRMVGGAKQGLDGRNRFKACQELHLKCPMKQVDVPDDEVKLYIVRRNIHDRRHMTAELRQALVAELRADGNSTRQIATAVGVSQSTVQRDIDAGESNGSPDTVTGSDDKRYPARKPAILCERCTRVGAVEGCNACKVARKQAKKTKKDARKAKGKEKSEVKDAFGKLVPKGLCPAFCDPWIGKALDFLVITSSAFRKERLSDGMMKRKKHYPFFVPQEFADGCGFIIDYLDKLIEHLKANRPAGVCPKCNGETCKDCRHSGLVPREVYKALK